jgi:CsoR family transcriptional regulator, copper-sensing transcriptional repressor
MYVPVTGMTGRRAMMIVLSRSRMRSIVAGAAGAVLPSGAAMRGLYHEIFPPSGLLLIPGRGILDRMRREIKASSVKRLNRIEGQVRGLSRMVEDDRYCIDIVTQIAAVRAALRRLEEEILRDHVGHCVEHAIASGNKAEQRQKIEELMAVVSRADR